MSRTPARPLPHPTREGKTRLPLPRPSPTVRVGPLTRDLSPSSVGSYEVPGPSFLRPHHTSRDEVWDLDTTTRSTDTAFLDGSGGTPVHLDTPTEPGSGCDGRGLSESGRRERCLHQNTPCSMEQTPSSPRPVRTDEDRLGLESVNLPSSV